MKPTDAAQLPDGRVLVLLRRLVWPMPPRFAGSLAIGDPAAIRSGAVWRLREVAKLSSSLAVDNFEGLAVEPLDGGRIVVWLISDDNGAVSQRSLIWKLSVNPADL
ncbi:MAG TPA: esterase-like activity of phytase family protein [Novosphingobium sp.]|nr:esterase-like activity of phytase family protein [Novosphingobium sp.]